MGAIQVVPGVEVLPQRHGTSQNRTRNTAEIVYPMLTKRPEPDRKSSRFLVAPASYATLGVVLKASSGQRPTLPVERVSELQYFGETADRARLTSQRLIFWTGTTSIFLVIQAYAVVVRRFRPCVD